MPDINTSLRNPGRVRESWYSLWSASHKTILQVHVRPRPFYQDTVADRSRTAHWDGRGDKGPRGFDDMSQSQENDSSQPAFTQTHIKNRPKSQSKPKPKAKTGMEMFDDPEDEEVEEVIGKAAIKGKGKALRGKKTQTLFDPDSEDEDVAPQGTFRDEEEDLDLTLQSDKGQKDKGKTRGTKRKIAEPEESDSEDGMNLRGFAKRAKMKR